MNEIDLVKIKINEALFDEKVLEKMFSEVNTNASLKEALESFTKAGLDMVRRTLKITGASSLKKAELIEVLNDKIKSDIPQIVSALSKTELKFLINIMDNGGVLKYSHNYIESALKLRYHGLIITAKINTSEKYLLIPQELRPDLNLLLNDVSEDIACTVITETDEPKIASIPLNFKGKISRNAQCPCGSGKKFKRCCITEKVSTMVY